MGKIATTIDEQIQKLSDRGMEMDLESNKIREILSDVGYYRLGFYWHPFQKANSHDFNCPIKFSTIVDLYYLDVDLRNLLMIYINRIEIHFRTKVVYHCSNKYLDNPVWFVDPKRIVRHSDPLKDYIKNFPKLYNDKFKYKNTGIKHHHSKYPNDKYAPAWKTLEYMSFGAIYTLFINLKDNDLKKEISRMFGIRDVDKFSLLMKTTVDLRNACAHGNVIFDLRFDYGIPSLPFLKIKREQRHSAYSGFRVVEYLIGCISKKRAEEFRNELNDILLKPDNKQLKDIVELKIGFIKS